MSTGLFGYFLIEIYKKYNCRACNKSTNEVVGSLFVGLDYCTFKILPLFVLQFSTIYSQ